MANENCMAEFQLFAFNVHWFELLHIREQQGLTRRALFY